MLNAQELIDRKIITGPITKDNIAQHGIDLNVIDIERISGMGAIPVEGKTKLANYDKVECNDFSFDEQGAIKKGWTLHPGVYSVTFEQGCNIPNDTMLLIRQRSSLLRNGTVLHSSVFDAGFQTQNIGTVIVVLVPIFIEYGARIAQIYNHLCTPIQQDRLYDGQWQNDKQRV